MERRIHIVTETGAEQRDLVGPLASIGCAVVWSSQDQWLSPSPCDVVVLAVSPPRTGQLVHTLSSVGRSWIVVAVTEEDRALGVECLRQGAHAMIRRPMEPNEVVAVVGRALEVLGLRESSDELRRMLTASERLAQLGQLSAGIAHEVRNPLSVIATNTAFVRQSVEGLLPLLPAEVASGALVRMVVEAAEDALGGVERLQEVIRDMSALASADAITRVPLDVNDAIRTAIRMTRTELGAHVRVVPRLGTDTHVVGSAGRLAQVFVNLLINAAQAIAASSRDGGLITITSRLQGAHVICEVTDNGPGITAEVLPRVFDAFVTTKSAAAGTGLGLYLCREIVERHGGRIEARSASGQGATFVVDLPADPDWLATLKSGGGGPEQREQ